MRRILLGLIFAVLAMLAGGAVSNAEQQAFYFITPDGKLYRSSYPTPAVSALKYIRTVNAPGATAGFVGLMYKGGYFYSTYPTSSGTAVVRFGLTPGDEDVLGYPSEPIRYMAPRSDGTVWVASAASTSSSTKVHTLDLATMALGTGVAPSPQFTLFSAGGNWSETGLTFDASNRLVVAFPGSYGIFRFSSLASGAWNYNCDSQNPLPCWYHSGNILGLTTDTSTGVIYALVCGSTSCQVRYLTLGESQINTRQDVATFVGSVSDTTVATFIGIAIAPASDDALYYISRGVIVPL